MDEIIAWAYLFGFAIGGSIIGARIQWIRDEAKIKSAKADGWNECDIHIKSRFHLHHKRKGSK